MEFVLRKEAWLGRRAGTTSGPGPRDYVQRAWQVGVHPLPWETLGCFPGKGIVCRRDSSRGQAAVHFGVGSSSHQFLKDGELDFILLRGPPNP